MSQQGLVGKLTLRNGEWVYVASACTHTDEMKVKAKRTLLNTAPFLVKQLSGPSAQR